MRLLEEKSVIKVMKALAAAKHGKAIVELSKSARSEAEAAAELGVELGAMVKALVFKIGQQYVAALLASDNECLMDNLPRALNLTGDVKPASEDEARAVTGFRPACIAPAGMKNKLPVVMDRSLKRFGVIYAYAGHRRCVFATTAAELKRISGAIVSYNIAAPPGDN